MKTLFLAVLKDVAGAPGEFQVLPDGRIEMEGYGEAVMDAEAAAAIIAEFKRRGIEMVIDYEHQTMEDVQAPAAGWIKDLLWKGKEGLWAVVEWTARAAEYLQNREYRYFSPVIAVDRRTGRVMDLINVALTNMPRMHNLTPLVAKRKEFETLEKHEKEDDMILKLKKLLGLADDAGEDKMMEALTLMVNRNRELEAQAGKTAVVACREVLEALGAKEGDGKDEVVRIVASLKAPADVAKTLSLEVAELKRKIAAMEQEDLVTLALKEGKTSPEELEKWGRNLAGTAPEQFRQIVLSRPAGSVIPMTEIVVARDKSDGVSSDLQQSVNRMLGIDDETFRKYNK
jgi:phage I-like protein